MYRQRRATALGGIVALVLATAGVVPVAAAPQDTGSAPGCCGTPATWSPGDKKFFGRAAAPANTADDVWFTGTNGILTELYYPTPDTPNFHDQQFIVGDAGHTWDAAEKTAAKHTVALTKDDALAWKVTNTGNNEAWRITKTIYTDPGSPVVDEHVTFTALRGTLGDYVLYQLSNPAQAGDGDSDTGTTATYNGRTMLVSSGTSRDGTTGTASAVAVGNGLDWLTENGAPMLSSGYVGTNDGWQDLLGGEHPDHAMSHVYDSASSGNIAQLGQLDLQPVAGDTSVSFDLAIGLGDDVAGAESAAESELALLARDPGGVLTSYEDQWAGWTAGLNTHHGVGGDQYLLSAMGLKAAQDPSSGAVVAGFGHPWGTSYGTDNPGYNRTWARDAYNIVTGMLVAGDKKDADYATHFLFDKQQRPDGHFPQNSLTDGTPSWTGIQMDETACPIILAWKLRPYDPELVGSSYYEDHIRPAANYIVANGPATPMERWEENGGYSPNTIAAEIAGLYLASLIAEQNGDTANADTFRSTADTWASKVVGWTYTTTGPYGNGNYFVRITPNGNADDGSTVTIGNGGGTHPENSIVDNGFLGLVTMGIMPADDPRVASTMKVTANPDADESAGSIMQTLPNGATGFFRYNHDGYGETVSGGNWTGDGIGRLWPILDGEYGQYQFLLGHDAGKYLSDLQDFTTPAGLLSEQVWGLDSPDGTTPGTPTRSASPLNWALSMYIQVAAATDNQQRGVSGLPGMPKSVYQHYAGRSGG